MADLVLTRTEGAVRVIAYNNPASRNSLAEGAFEALTEAVTQAQSEPDVGAVVLTGVGDYFCSGGDLNQLATRAKVSAEQRREGIEALHSSIRVIRECPKPVVAAVEGGAAGAGVSLALACDLLVVARAATFSVAYIKVGLTPDGGVTSFLADSMPRQLLTELCLTGDPVSAERLTGIGTVNRLVEPGTAEAEAVALAARVAAGPSRATSRIKELCRQAFEATLDEQLDAEAVRMVASMGDAEATEGIGAFFAKRRADSRGVRAADVP